MACVEDGLRILEKDLIVDFYRRFGGKREVFAWP